MAERPQYSLRIDAFTPDTFPMKRLAEYLGDLAALLGETDSVHLCDVTEGSAQLNVKVDRDSVPMVNRRLTMVSNHEAPKKAMKAYESIDKRLAADNSAGQLVAIAGKSESVVIRFPGNSRPVPPDFGLIKQQGCIDGVLVSIGGQDSTSHAILTDHDRTYTGINLNREQAKAIAPMLYSVVVRVHGSGVWFRDDDGQWQLKRFVVDSFEKLDDTPLSELVDQMRATPNNGWSKIEDPTNFILGDSETNRL